VKMVAVTGWGQEEDRRQTAAAGFDGHLVKPVAPGTLVELIGDLRSRP
jgi:CheY-like chemotaxis protein